MNQVTLDYLVIGHITRDIKHEGGWRAGGTVTYSSLTALKLGLSVGVFTSANTASELEISPRISQYSIPSAADTVFENVYTPSGRRQYLRSVADALTPDKLPNSWRQAPIVHLGPVAQEVSPLFLDYFPHALIGLTPQGWLRQWDSAGQVYPLALQNAEAILAKASCVILSLEDLGGDTTLLDKYICWSRLLVRTRGVDGSTVYIEGSKYDIPAYEAVEVDPTGAGDVFATAFLIRYHETQDPLIAAQFANCVASFVVEGPGTSTIPDREQVERRLHMGKLRKAE